MHVTGAYGRRQDHIDLRNVLRRIRELQTMNSMPQVADAYQTVLVKACGTQLVGDERR